MTKQERKKPASKPRTTKRSKPAKAVAGKALPKPCARVNSKAASKALLKTNVEASSRCDGKTLLKAKPRVSSKLGSKAVVKSGSARPVRADASRPEKLQPREKLLKLGVDALNDAELLSIFLGTGTKGLPVLPLAGHLLDDFGGIRGLVSAGKEHLCSRTGIGPAKCAIILAALELAKRYLLLGLERGETITDPTSTGDFLRLRLRESPREIFACLFLDNQHRLIAYEELFFGTIDGASVHPREVVRCALAHNAAAVIFAHNHPSGVAEPSQADRRITERLQSALSLIDVRVLDHMVVGDLEVVSFAERGLL